MTYTFKTDDAQEALIITNANKMYFVLEGIINNLAKDVDRLEESDILTVENIRQLIADYTQEITHLYE
jgi:hypothetical protein